jgi:hypothetical protein
MSDEETKEPGCPNCGSPLEDNGCCSDVGDNNCQYIKPVDVTNVTICNECCCLYIRCTCGNDNYSEYLLKSTADKQLEEMIKPCPCCGSKASLHRNNSIFAGQSFSGYGTQSYGFRIECEGRCHLMTCWWHTKQQAIEHWNMRESMNENNNVPTIFEWKGCRFYYLVK